MMIRIFNLLFIVLGTVRLVYGQVATADAKHSFKEVVLKMREEYKNLEKLHVVMSIQAFENSSAKTPYFSEIADMKRDKHNYLYKFAGHEMLLNDKFMLMVDHSSREIFCNTRDVKAELAGFKNGVQFDLDSLLQFYGDVEYVGRYDRIDKYRIAQKVGQLEIIELFIDSSKSLLKRLDYTYRDKQYVRIEFNVFNQTPSFDTGLFSEMNYITKNNKGIVSSGKFKGFTVSKIDEN